MATALLVAGLLWPFGYLCLHPPARIQVSFKALGCSYNCRRLTHVSFQLMHMSCDDHAVQLIEPWRPKPRQNIITMPTTLPQGWVSASKHQCTTVITTTWTESLSAFPESYTANRMTVGLCAWAMAEHKRTIIEQKLTLVVELRAFLSPRFPAW